jgi:hypothetical protein
LVGLIMIAMYMCSYQQLHAILVTIKGDPELVRRIQTDLPGTYWEISERLFPGLFFGGKHPRFSPSGIEFKQVFVENPTKFERAVKELKELLKLVNTTDNRAAVPEKIKELSGSSNLHGLNVFRLQLFVPIAALCGMVIPENLFHADYIEPAEGIDNGSYSALTETGIERHRHPDALLNICGHVGLPRRHSLGECLTCESHRSKKRYDLFQAGQNMFHLFLLNSTYSVKLKLYNQNEWIDISMMALSTLQAEECG